MAECKWLMFKLMLYPWNYHFLYWRPLPATWWRPLPNYIQPCVYIYLCIGWRWTLHSSSCSSWPWAEGHPWDPQLPLCQALQPREHLHVRAWGRGRKQLGQRILSGVYIVPTHVQCSCVYCLSLCCVRWKSIPHLLIPFSGLKFKVALAGIRILWAYEQCSPRSAIIIVNSC